MSLKKYIHLPQSLWNNIYTTGSSYICDPPVLNTDRDFVIYSKKADDLVAFLYENEFTTTSTEGYHSENNCSTFVSLRRDNLNLIVVDDYDFYLKWVIATELAKKLNLKEKQQRIDLFSYILYKN